MSTRVRVEFDFDGGHFAGWRAAQQLKLLAAAHRISVPEKLPRWSQLVYIYEHLEGRKKIVVFREKRRLAPKRSRYIKLCQDYRIGKKIKPVRGVVLPFNAIAAQQQMLREQLNELRGGTNVPTPTLRAQRHAGIFNPPDNRGDRGRPGRITYTIPTQATIPQGTWDDLLNPVVPDNGDEDF